MLCWILPGTETFTREFMQLSDGCIRILCFTCEKKTFCFLFKLFAEFPKFSALPFHSEEQEIITCKWFHLLWDYRIKRPSVSVWSLLRIRTQPLLLLVVYNPLQPFEKLISNFIPCGWPLWNEWVWVGMDRNWLHVTVKWNCILLCVLSYFWLPAAVTVMSAGQSSRISFSLNSDVFVAVCTVESNQRCLVPCCMTFLCSSLSLIFLVLLMCFVLAGFF